MDTLKRLVRQKGLKYTRQREAVWSAFLQLERGHPSCEEIYHLSREISPGLGWATVYRTLKWMKELGFIVERDFGNRKIRFERGEKREIHGHLVCSCCGKVIEVKDRAITELWKRLAKEYGFELFQERLKGFGLCSECKSKTPS